MYLREGDYGVVYIDFFEVFKNYDEFGSGRRIICLKYFVLVNLFMKFGINFFDFQEVKFYKNDLEILVMINFVSAYQNDDINEFEKIFKINRKNIVDDFFIREYIEDFLRNIRI